MSYDFTDTAKWLDCYPAAEMASTLKNEAFNLVSFGLEKCDVEDPKEVVLRMFEHIRFVCDFLKTIKEVRP